MAVGDNEDIAVGDFLIKYTCESNDQKQPVEGRSEVLALKGEVLHVFDGSRL